MNRQYRLSSAVLAVTTLLTSVPALAQTVVTYSRLGGPVVDVNFLTQPPSELTYCRDRYRADGYALDACTRGMSEAKRMAERYAGGWGRTQGYLRGYAWGLYKMSGTFRNDATEIARGRQGVDAIGSTMEAGLEAGRTDGQRQGSPRGAQDAIARFKDVLNTGRTPDPALRVPTVSYSGIDNAYEKYVGKARTEQEIIQQDIRPEELRVYDSWDAMYLGEKQPLTVFDLIFADGTYQFERGRFYDSALAWNVWLDRRTVLDPNGLYTNLNNGIPANADGSPRNLQPLFQEGFRQTYDYYVNFYYSSKFHEMLDLGTQHGAEMGTQVGKRLAQQTGLIQAYNEKFKESSRRTFQDAFAGAYTSAFNSTFADYNNNAKLSISLLSLIGVEDDGIIQPGEEFKLRFSVENLGGKASPLALSVLGDVRDTVAQTLQIGALSSKVFTSEVIGRIDPRMAPRSNARIILDVNGIKDDLSQTILRMTQIAATKANLEINAGAGTVIVTAVNTATVRTPGIVEAKLLVNGREVDSQVAGSLNAGAQQEIVLRFENINPLALINNSVKVGVVVTMSGVSADQAVVSTAVANRDAALASYFNALANSRGFVPTGETLQSQIDEVRATIVSDNNAETQQNARGRNVYKKDPDSTIVGGLVKLFEATSQSQEAREQYDVLARALKPARKNLRNFLFFGGKRKSYDRLIDRLAQAPIQ